ERERFLAAAAHELKTPLAAIKGFAQMALGHMDEPERLAPALGIIDRQATRLARLSQDLVWAARAQASQLRVKPAPTDLEALTRRVLGDVENMTEGRAWRMEVVGDVHVLVDAALVEHAIWSVLTFAAGISTPADPIVVKIEEEATLVRLSV